MTSFLEELRWRGQLHQTAGEGLEEHLRSPSQGGVMRVAYAGFDPTSDSLTIGNFIPAKALMHWQQCGHKPIVLMGGGTGLIGDPSGRESERTLMSREQVEANVASQRRILEKFLDFDRKRPNGAIIVNNADWLTTLGFLDVLRDVGKHFSVNEMIQRDSVRKRLEQRDHGISYTEFSYMLLQAYDFLHLFRTLGCTVQVGGADQYGNIVSGMDLIRREHAGAPDKGRAFGVTVPLVTRSDGKKMSKSEGTAIFMSDGTRDRTTPYAFYQFWINLPDADAVQWIMWYTLMPRDEVESLAAQQQQNPQDRPAQRALARHMTTLVHGTAETARIEAASRALFSGEVRELDAASLRMICQEIPHVAMPRDQVIGAPVVDLLVASGAAASKREAREFIQKAAVTVSGRPVSDPASTLLPDHVLPGGVALFRRGKKTWAAVMIRD
ncbi:MAG: tyrosine--tRNA ligase [Phycisphaeraceae bacterium]|nr:tyrosine--tRNA ligase [Phycisphaerales bacterium]QOJ17999.1 MAG: tyrosine--tRNA ligase [Phycisphaeraceae bacterium]